MKPYHFTCTSKVYLKFFLRSNPSGRIHFHTNNNKLVIDSYYERNYLKNNRAHVRIYKCTYKYISTHVLRYMHVQRSDKNVHASDVWIWFWLFNRPIRNASCSIVYHNLQTLECGCLWTKRFHIKSEREKIQQ